MWQQEETNTNIKILLKDQQLIFYIFKSTIYYEEMITKFHSTNHISLKYVKHKLIHNGGFEQTFIRIIYNIWRVKQAKNLHKRWITNECAIWCAHDEVFDCVYSMHNFIAIFLRHTSYNKVGMLIFKAHIEQKILISY